MKENRVDHFKHKSKSWDMSSMRVKNAKSIADLIVKNINFNDTMEIMDLGAGTGLLSYFIAPHVTKIIAVDNSPSMLEEFKSKASEFDSETEVIEADIAKEELNRSFDGIISSMTIHHVEETKALFSKLYGMLNANGFIAIADLDSEDGSFHSDNTGVLANGAVALSTHARIDQNLTDGIFGRSGFLHLPGPVHGINKILAVVAGNILQGIGNTVDEVVLFDNSHGRRVALIYSGRSRLCLKRSRTRRSSRLIAGYWQELQRSYRTLQVQDASS